LDMFISSAWRRATPFNCAEPPTVLINSRTAD
jgi:hypothetical protein